MQNGNGKTRGAALSNALHSSAAEDGRLSFAGSAGAELIADIFCPEDERQSELFDFFERSGEVKTCVLTDLSGWLSGLREEFRAKNPFAAEEAFIQKLQSARNAKLSLDALERIQDEYEILPSVNDDMRGDVAPSAVEFDFYRSELKVPQGSEAADDDAAKTALAEGKALFRHLKRGIQTEYAARKTQWELERAEQSRGDFMRGLYKKIAAFQKLQPLVSPFVDNAERLWSLAASPFCETGFDVLQEYAKFLEKDEFIAQLADVLGRSGRAPLQSECEKAVRAAATTEYEMRPSFGGRRAGLRFSGEIASALPSELALYNHEAARKYFALKFGQKQLLSYAYERAAPKKRALSVRREEQKAVLEPRGPVLICIDTSSSMQGEPERIAKTAAFALAKTAVSEKRGCYFISFSTGIEMLDVSRFEGGEAVSRLARFLNASFNGGTDASPALAHAVEQLQTRRWENADVLMISDFIMASLPPVLEDKIKTEQKKGTGFYALSVGDECSCNSRMLKLFDAHWNYNPRRRAPQEELIKSLTELKVRKAACRNAKN
ncbi:MAG: VWA domain-containing protein [Treponema sp.]